MTKEEKLREKETKKETKRADRVAKKLEKRASAFKSSLSGIASVSFIIALFDRLWEIVYNALVNGFFGRVFSGYKKNDRSFENSFLRELVFGDRRFKKIFRRTRKFLSSNIETCFVVTRGQRMIRYLCSAPVNYYGNFLAFFGVYTCVVYFARLVITNLDNAGNDHLIIGVASIIVSLPLLFSRVSLATAVCRSVVGRLIFEGAFGVSEETFKKYAVARNGRGNLMLFLGLVFGVMTFFVHPLDIIQAVVVLALICLVAVTPEIGLLITIFALPFCSFTDSPTLSLCALVLLTAFFYVIKLIRGKRVFKLELIDGAVLLFAILTYLASVFSAGGEDSKNAALVSCTLMLGYFLLVNLMRTEKWIKRCVAALVGSGAIVAVIGVFEYFLGSKSSQWLDTSLFTDINRRVVSLFDNPNVLAAYLVLIFPFALNFLVQSKKRNERFLSFFVCAAILLATVFTWSRGAWIALVMCIIVFFTVFSRKTFRVLGVAVVATPVLAVMLPSNLIDRVLSILNFSDSSISYRIYSWIGSIRLAKDHFLGGIGLGPEAFSRIYPTYAFSGIETAEHSHSLLLQILIGMGIGGLLTFVILTFLYFQKTLEYVKRPENNSAKLYVVAALSAVMGMLIMGIFDYVWYNYRVFYIFWIVIAIGCAFVRVGNSEEERRASASMIHAVERESKD